jgi:hypothetical protein
MWNIGTSGTATGSLSGFVRKLPATRAHQRRLTGWSGKAATPWFVGRRSTPNSVFVSSSRKIE